jgi:hypothetical protein
MLWVDSRISINILQTPGRVITILPPIHAADHTTVHRKARNDQQLQDLDPEGRRRKERQHSTKHITLMLMMVEVDQMEGKKCKTKKSSTKLIFSCPWGLRLKWELRKTSLT